MATKVKDLAVITGSYTKDGEQKNRYMNIGSMMKNDDGGFFLILDRTFNPAGLPNPENRSSCVVSVFDLRQQQAPQQQTQHAQPASPQAGPDYGVQGGMSPEDDVPFNCHMKNTII